MPDSFVSFFDGRVAVPSLVKVRAKEVRAHLAAVDIHLCHSQCLELIVQQLGFKTYAPYLSSYSTFIKCEV